MHDILYALLFVLVGALMTMVILGDGKNKKDREALALIEREFNALGVKYQKLQQELQQKRNLQKELQQARNELQQKRDLVSQTQDMLLQKDNQLDSCMRENFELKQWNEKLECQLRSSEENGTLMLCNTAALQNRQEFLDMCVSKTMQQLSEAGVDMDEPVNEELLAESATSSLGKVHIRSVLTLKNRLLYILLDNNIHTMGELLLCRASDLLGIRNFGHGLLNEIVTELGKHGLKLMDEEDAKKQARIKKILLPSRKRLTTVEELELSASVYNAVKSSGCDVVDDLYDYRFLSHCDDDAKSEIRACLDLYDFPPPLF